MKEPASATGLFKRETPNDIIIMVQINHHIGATWTEIPMLPIAILFLRLWAFRLRQGDAGRIFNIVDEQGRDEAIDILTSRQLSHCVLLLAITQFDVIGSAIYDSLNGLINQEIKPHFRKYWRDMGIPVNVELFPQLVSEIEEFKVQSKELQKNWLQKTHGGARNFGGFLGRPDVREVVEFIDRVQPLWKYIIRYFAAHDYEADCINRIDSDVDFIRLSGGEKVPARLLKQVYRRNEAQETSATPRAVQARNRQRA